ncbi:MAG: hypothetical protein AB7N76_25945 [Planctomycetota bacterium]
MNEQRIGSDALPNTTPQNGAADADELPTGRRPMQTERVPLSEAVLQSPALARRVAVRTMKAEEWVERHASGTLRKNKRLGFAWKSQYRDERTCFEFGWEFELLPSTQINFNVAITEGDQKALTEAGWFVDRLLTIHPFPEDDFELKYVIADYRDGPRREGVGLILRQTSAPWIPAGHMVFAIVAEWDPRAKRWLGAKNPC